ncbi:unnamed protein product [Cylindrotheca closterium]|uniref:Uncharacterized protein n=1 Tax=Cylindrotheca closterium TaxID=2856 RepID=A0AAD2FMJ8_9STRA|nr:unnamed protein product [Cylindrotheca closterium]
MISNFHQSSGPYENPGSSYYTFDAEPSAKAPTAATKKTKKKSRIFGLGKSKNKNKKANTSMPALDDQSTMTGQSLTYSTSAASYQTTGESTDSSGGAFGEILKLLDEEERLEMKEKHKRRYSSDRSTTSSLAYSEGATTLNYSEDGDMSFLEGTKLLGMLEAPPQPAGGAQHEDEEENKEYMISPKKTPVINNKKATKTQNDGRQSHHNARENSVVRQDERTREREVLEVDDDPVSSTSNRWMCGIDFGDAGSVLRPFLCF